MYQEFKTIEETEKHLEELQTQNIQIEKLIDDASVTEEKLKEQLPRLKSKLALVLAKIALGKQDEKSADEIWGTIISIRRRQEELPLMQIGLRNKQNDLKEVIRKEAYNLKLMEARKTYGELKKEIFRQSEEGWAEDVDKIKQKFIKSSHILEKGTEATQFCESLGLNPNI